MAQLPALVTGRRVECTPKDRDRSGRMIAVCRVDGFDIGAEMVHSGMAFAFTKESVEYVNQESEAKGGRSWSSFPTTQPRWTAIGRPNT